MKQLVLSLDTIVPYLLEKDLINNKTIVDGDLKIIDASRRNRNLKVLRNYESSLLIKQSLTVNRNYHNTIERESKLYSYIDKYADEQDIIKKFIPKFFFMDEKNKILVIEYIKNSITLNEYIRSSMPGNIGLEPFYLLGKNMSSYHIFFESHFKKNKLDFIHRKSPPSIFFLRPHPRIFELISGANLRLIKIIQKNQELVQSLESIYQDWKVQTLVHGDIKWDNIIISGSDPNSYNTYIVDWELIEAGDPAWDIAGIFHDFITYWIHSISSSKMTQIEDLKIPMNTSADFLKEHLRTFWTAYIVTKQMTSKESNYLLLKSTRYCATRLIQKVYEMHQFSQVLSNNAFYMVQISSNIMKNTEDAIIHLFGIPFRYVG